ncbi:hypothetical protein KUCAC02_004542 [Chaenocephalus aceratus]|uniref:Uncharacterized protein n=1 Tax=Chaenocephalus aceratus TaxID=36190 RepID=A0ACB9WZI4_CHAAC|nr:hypothetical protein KUCAC02_004542 [Chaenocephalus aceratus]
MQRGRGDEERKGKEAREERKGHRRGEEDSKETHMQRGRGDEERKGKEAREERRRGEKDWKQRGSNVFQLPVKVDQVHDFPCFPNFESLFSANEHEAE